MKLFYTFLISISAFSLSSFVAPSSIDKVVSALKSGNAGDLAKYFDDNVELTLPDKSNSYSKAQAQLIVKDFFADNKVKGFSLKHKGNSSGGDFCIGTLHTNSGDFRTNVFMKNKGGKSYVKEIRFQPLD